MKDRVTKLEVADFKNKWCNENPIIASIVKNKIANHFKPPILDVGAGLGDIDYNALADKEVICIDVNKITEEDYPLADKHKRIQIDFFDYIPEKPINTVFISHTLQFIDEDVVKLNEKLNEIAPDNLIIVLNKNNDFMGELIEWSEQHYENPNPEVKLDNFPIGYSQVEQVDFKAKLTCDSFDHLANQISYLMLIDLDATKQPLLISFLNERLSNPEFEFNQVIEIYTKNGGK
ncbi:hypothetical protein ACFLR1_03160 [Bacteroidota bacterium]